MMHEEPTSIPTDPVTLARMAERFRSRYALHTGEVLDARFVQDCLEYATLSPDDER